LSVQTIARLLGVPRGKFSAVMTWLGDYGVATAAAATGFPVPDAALLDRGHRAAQALLDFFGALKEDKSARGPLLDALVQEADRAGIDNDKDIVANAVGYLLQGYAATASLIGLTLLALSRQPALLAQVKSDRKLLRQIVQEVVRCDPTTNSTLRFMARDGVVLGQKMQKGDLIIVLIAAANRDPALNRDPDRFDVMRQNRKYLEFGTGPHACPANELAPLIALIGVDHLMTLDIQLEGLEDSLSYAVSGHIRTPLFRN
jgi:cytochrome P450